MSLDVTIAFFGCVALLVLTCVLYVRFYSQVKLIGVRTEERLDEAIINLGQTLEDKLSPKIHVHDSAETVSASAAELIGRATAEEKEKDRFITIYGAASLSAAGSEKGNQSSDLYSKALEDASREKVQIHRYVSLFTQDEFEKRGREVRSQYLAWLHKQCLYLASNELYRLEDVPRAPKWGANMARLISCQAVMEITGNGEAAVVIEDQETARIIRDFARKAVLGGQNLPVCYSQSVGHETVSRLRENADRLLKIHDKFIKELSGPQEEEK